MTAITVSVPREDESVPENRRPLDGRSPARRAAQRSTGVAVDDTHEALGVDRAEVARAPEGGDDLACLFLDGIGASRDGEGGA
jgi:hypothetical protein